MILTLKLIVFLILIIGINLYILYDLIFLVIIKVLNK
jgi:hypothetical protein